ncbi:hypothetical protein G4Z16_24945 [Streptomyces bathyalis]|uniref:Uncharacterized protein n=1 Tax=Streptomyces bathyalis TaxID=2710756 RepID=A0A7T1TA09_9ACTN|nr:hypothetical protein [Streptomyces bathyalis]QPP09120.1 hypothetical protein G4Z16_24945 [Streptomyces bathyalis]
MTAPTPRTLPSPGWPAATEHMPALPTTHEMFLDVMTAPMEVSAQPNSDFAVSRAGWPLGVELMDSHEAGS